MIVMIMKRMYLSDYSSSLGTLIDVRHPVDYKNQHPDSINIYYEKLMYNHKIYLQKDKAYYITCEKGLISKKCVKYLDLLGYNVTQVIKN